MIPTILSTARTAIANVSRSWASQYPMRGTRTSFFKLCRVRAGPYCQLEETGFSLGRHPTRDECPLHRLPLAFEQLPLGGGSWGFHAGDRRKRQLHQQTTLAIRDTTKKTDHGPMQKGKWTRDSFDAVRVLERKERRKWQVNVMFASPVYHAQRRGMPYATAANGRQRDYRLGQPKVGLPQYLHCQRPPSREKSLGARYIVRYSRNADDLMGKKGLWSFGHTDKTTASFDTRRLFSDFTDATSKETGGSTFEMTEGPDQKLGYGTTSPVGWQLS